MKKNKYFLIPIFFAALLLLFGGVARALEVKNYPNIPGLISPSSECTGEKCLSIFVAYWFGLLVYIAGFLSAISFVIGAIGLINPNVEAHKDATDRMKGAVLGLLLTFASFIIIKTINPALINQTYTPLPEVQGIFYWNGTNKKPVAMSEINMANRGQELIDGKFDKILYECKDNLQQPPLLMWQFPNAGLESNNDLKNVSVARITCGNTFDVSGVGSFYMEFETPGVYYYLEEGCKGYMSRANVRSQNEIAAPFKGKVASVKIINGELGKEGFGVIFHQVANLSKGGGCNYPIKGSNCQDVKINESTAGVDIFQINGDPASSGDGVVFYSKPFGIDRGRDAGFYPVGNERIKPVFYSNAEAMDFEWPSTSQLSDNYRRECQTFQYCPGSINIAGDYLVALYSHTSSGGLYCQTFTGVEYPTVPNLGAQPIIAAGGGQLQEVYVIPTK